MNGFSAALIISLVGLVPLLFKRKTRLLKAPTGAKGEKFVDYAQSVFWLMYIVSALVVLLGLGIIFFAGQIVAGFAFLIMGLVFIIPIAIMQAVDSTVRWNESFIEGPMSGYRFKKNRIFWEDVVKIKHNPNSTLQLEDRLGNRVVWSVYYAGWKDIIFDLERLNPKVEFEGFD